LRAERSNLTVAYLPTTPKIASSLELLAMTDGEAHVGVLAMTDGEAWVMGGGRERGDS